MGYTLEQMLDYIKQFEGRYYHNRDEEQVKLAVSKIEQLITRFGFKFVSTFSMRYGGSKHNSSNFYRLQTGEFTYIEVQLGYLPKTKVYGKGWRKQTFVSKYEGLCRVYKHAPGINPSTGRPYQIGDVKYVNANYSLILTKDGWWSGD
ncbi:hypothetical protein COF68_04490 [Bacillus toyonensis]|uniref:hypothetical protein n=1 Tax=Bacillus toyonensis TaxID=155322 RepID=UPI000BFDAACF|nr:hypothetical protein [Bacillus toyonensis]PHE64113.1 hypothetical protein COF68_04490 [Bacillus toyonensis]